MKAGLVASILFVALLTMAPASSACTGTSTPSSRYTLEDPPNLHRFEASAGSVELNVREHLLRHDEASASWTYVDSYQPEIYSPGRSAPPYSEPSSESVTVEDVHGAWDYYKGKRFSPPDGACHWRFMGWTATLYADGTSQDVLGLDAKAWREPESGNVTLWLWDSTRVLVMLPGDPLPHESPSRGWALEPVSSQEALTRAPIEDIPEIGVLSIDGTWRPTDLPALPTVHPLPGSHRALAFPDAVAVSHASFDEGRLAWFKQESASLPWGTTLSVRDEGGGLLVTGNRSYVLLEYGGDTLHEVWAHPREQPGERLMWRPTGLVLASDNAITIAAYEAPAVTVGIAGSFSGWQDPWLAYDQSGAVLLAHVDDELAIRFVPVPDPILLRPSIGSSPPEERVDEGEPTPPANASAQPPCAIDCGMEGSNETADPPGVQGSQTAKRLTLGAGIVLVVGSVAVFRAMVRRRSG